MFNRIIFQNYRLFKSEQKLEIRPITVIFGKNNSGKSAVLKLPLLLKAALECKSAEVFDLDSVQGARFCGERKDVVYNHALLKETRLGMYCDKNDLSLDYSFTVSPTTTPESVICTWNGRIKDNSLAFDLLDEATYSVAINGRESQPESFTFEGLTPCRKSADGEMDVELLKKGLDFNIDYLGSMRCTPDIDMRLITPVKEHSSHDGSNNYQHLLQDDKNYDKKLIEAVSSWYEQYFDGWQINVDNSRYPVYHIEMSHFDPISQTTIKSNIVETGVGIVQSLPVITRVCRSCDSPTLIELEEPESHLHPAAHAGMAQIIAESVLSDGNKSYLIETHSQNFLLRLRRLVAEHRLPLDMIALYYVEFDSEKRSSQLVKVDLRSDGSVSNWPKGVFEETLTEALAIRKAQQNQQ